MREIYEIELSTSAISIIYYEQSKPGCLGVVEPFT